MDGGVAMGRRRSLSALGGRRETGWEAVEFLPDLPAGPWRHWLSQLVPRRNGFRARWGRERLDAGPCGRGAEVGCPAGVAGVQVQAGPVSRVWGSG